MVVGHGGEFVDGHVFVHGGDDFVDELAAEGADATAADDLAGLGVGQEFNEAVFGLHDEGFAVVGEGVFGGEVRDVADVGAVFGEADGGDLGVGEDDFAQEAVIDGFGGVGVDEVVGGGFGLLDGDMNDFVQAGAVAGGKDVRRGGPHVKVGGDAAVFELDPRLVEAERGDLGDAAEGVED